MAKDHIQRGDYTYKIAPRLVFSITRIADPLIAVLLLIYWVDKFKYLSDVSDNWRVVIFLTCLLIAAIKQIYWAWILSRERFTWFMALFPWNNLLDWLWIYFLSKALNTNLHLSTWISIGATFFFIGSLIEFISNFQLHYFKRDPNNGGKLYTGGLFSVVIHPNYTGYTLWRSALPLMTGYPGLAGISLLLHVIQFTFHADPPFQKYMNKKYGQAWKLYTASRKKIIPGVL
jgi:steroid 5-alpha reductase family enzyme